MSTLTICSPVVQTMRFVSPSASRPHRLVAHPGGGDAITGRGASAPLDVAQMVTRGIEAQLLLDLLAHGDAAGRALGHHDQ